MVNRKLVSLAVVLAILVLKSSAREYSKCEVQRAVALVKTKECGMLGVFVPHCEKDGSYSPIQCYTSGYCCCADPDSGKQSDCVKAPEVPHCCKKECKKQRAAALKLVELGLLGVFVPHCEKDGTYSPIQTPLANQFCCAEPCSGKLSNCVIGPKRPDCTKREYSKCELQRAVAMARTKECGMLGVFVPHCEKDGSYSPMQCKPIGYCCCADPDSGKQSDCVRAPKVPHCSK